MVLARRVLVVRGLRDRVRLEVRPSEEHDPGPEQVLQLTAALARAHRTSRRPRAARGVRIEIAPDADGVVHWLLSGPAGSRAGLEAALAAYPDVDLHDPPPGPTGAGGRRLRTVRCELVLARPAHDPLAATDQVADLHTPIAAVMSGLLTDAGEHATVALDVHVASPGRARRLRHRMAHRAEGRGTPAVPSATGGRQNAPERVERRHETRGLARKLDPAEVLLDIQLLLCVGARTARARSW